jgi:hypothetical protein
VCQCKITGIVFAPKLQGFNVVDINGIRVQHHVDLVSANKTIALLGSVQLLLQVFALIGRKRV